jgi:cardiolipin synthase A/B
MSSRLHGRQAVRRPKTQPHRYRQRNVPREWRHRLEPPLTRARRRERRKIVPSLLGRARRLLWWWPLWALVCGWALSAREWAIAAVGGALTVLAHTIAPRDPGLTYGIDHETPVDSPEFLDGVVGTTGVPLLEDNLVDLLNNGDEFYPAMLDAIRGARRSITIEAYIYWHGEIGLEFARAIAERARAGVAVKILLDTVGSATVGREILRTLEGGGCQLAWFNPIGWYTLDRFNYRTHRKSVIVDGIIEFTGGAGIADHWLGCAQDHEHWRDTQVRVIGQGAVPLQTGFAQNWLRTTGELITGSEFFPRPPHTGRVAVQTVLSSPAGGSSTVRTLYYLSIVSSRRSILIANPYFVPDQVAIEALTAARARGVDVKIVVSGIRNDNWLARQNSVRLYGKLLRANIEIYEYNRTMLHQKTMSVDSAWATVGTANFDNRSFAFNEESNVSFHDRALVRQLEESFYADLAVSRRVTLEAWRRRGVLARAQEILASVFEDQV